VLENHAGGVAAQISELAFLIRADIFPIDDDFACRGFNKAENTANEGGFATTREPHNDKELTLIDSERDIPYCYDTAGLLQYGLSGTRSHIGVEDLFDIRAENFPQLADLNANFSVLGESIASQDYRLLLLTKLISG